ncbi:Bug family tripartite tricarboxylate transporter substrate binding protein [Undibacter mobilis]|uniref:Tripartite tricarboxylate transporter substrate binding protein n=1 Tax=Undibacter mobilis TaxID=2292256 RepID=A0A371B3I7_9BRAD|nr:tripartite tricarboxylate transporter substrate binding protein [Undibacter mobilis]RDV02013.1 tripartite tricarboxylate transporter substrate binding protein [Undibacter mobilis]
MLRTLLKIFAPVVIGGALPLIGPVAHAGDYPDRPVHLVVSYPAGGATDLIGRLLAEALGDKLGQRIVVDNRGGASGMLGARFAAEAKPDGYTIVIATATTHAVNPWLFRNTIGYDAIKSFTPISYVGYTPLVLVAHPSVPASNVKELLAYIKSKNNDISYANGGTGSVPHMAGELFNATAGIKVQTVPYKGDGPATTDVLAGHLPYMFAHLPVVLPLIRSGQLKAIGVTTPQRSEFAPDIPTIAEQGLPNYSIETWWGIFGPAKMPKDIVFTLNTAIRDVLTKPDVKKLFFDRGYETRPTTPEEFGAYVKKEYDRWGKIVEESGMQVN